MLTRNFLSAEALQLTEDEHAALVLVLGALERGEIKYKSLEGTRISGYHPASSPFYPPTDMGLNMTAIFARGDECGTTACLCGWAQYLAQDYELFLRITPPGLQRLFVFTEVENLRAVVLSEHIKPEEAAQALRNYLSTGEPKWDEVLAPGVFV